MKTWILQIYRSYTDFSREMNRNHISAFASSAAFFIFLSVIPFGMLLLACIPYTPVTQSDLLQIAIEIVPASLESMAVNLILQLYKQPPAVLSISAVIAVWSAAKGFLALMRGLNSINGVVETRNYLLLRLRASVYTIFFLFIILLCLMLIVFGNSLIDFILMEFPNVGTILKMILQFRFLISLALLSFFFLIVFKVLPNRSLSIAEQIPGAIFTAVIWYAFSFFFSIYVEKFGGFNMYGSMTTITIFLFWLYACMYIMLLGAEMNVYFEPFFSYYRVWLLGRRKRKTKKENVHFMG